MAERTTTTTRATTIPATREATTVTTKAPHQYSGKRSNVGGGNRNKTPRYPQQQQGFVQKNFKSNQTKTTITIITEETCCCTQKKRFPGKRLRDVKNVQIASANESIPTSTQVPHFI